MKYLNFKLLFFLAALVLAIPPAWAGTVTTGFNLAGLSQPPYSVTATEYNVTTDITGSSNETWTVSISELPYSGMSGSSGSKYWQIGKKDFPAPSIVFSTNDLNGTITKIVVNCASYNGLGSINATVDGNAFGTQNQSIPKWSNNLGGNVTFEGNASGEITITMANASDGRAMYIQSITVTYVEGGDTPANPWIDITPDPLNMNDDGGVFTVSAGNMPDGGLGVSVDSSSPSNAFSFSKTNDNTFNDQYNYFPLTGNANNKYDLENGTVQVNYTGHALSAAGVIKFASSPESATADVNYLYDGDIYIVGDVEGSGWSTEGGSVHGVPLVKNADGTYSVTITATAGGEGFSWLYFTKSLNASNYYDLGYNRFGPAGDDGSWSYNSGLNGVYCDLDTYGNLHTIKMSPGNYIFTIDPANNKFKIEEVAGPKIYNKVTDASQLQVGKKYILVYESTTPAFLGGIYEASTPYGLSITGPSISENSVDISQSSDIRELTLSGDANGWSFHNGNGYLSCPGGNSLNTVSTIEDNYAKWTVDYKERQNTGAGFVLTNVGNTDRVLQYNSSSPRFACYTSIQKYAVLYVEDGVEPVLPTVVAPTILPEEREFASSVEVSMTCATTGATIYYTVDGTDPTTSSTAYTAPFTLNATTTVKAIAVLGNENSQVVTATFTKTGIETIAAANGLDNNTNFTFVGNAVVTFHNGNHLYIRDDYGSGLIFGVNAETKKYNNGDLLTPGWKAKKIVYQDYTPEFTNASGVGSTANNGPVAPEILNALALTDVNKYAGFNDVTITRVDGENYYCTVGEQEICLRRAYTELVNALEVGKVYNVEGVVAVFSDAPQLNLTKVTLVKQAPELSFNPTGVSVYEGVQDFPEPALTAPEGVTVQSYKSSNPNVVTVDNEGNVTIVGVGTAVITATTAENDYYLSGTVTYNVEIKAKEAAGLSFGVTEPVTATYGDGNNFDEPELTKPAGLTVTYTCKPETVATVDPATGEVTIVGAGTATVTATTEGDESHNGGSATYTIIVGKADATLTFAENEIEATYGGEVPANALTNEAGLTVAYSSGDESIATVDNEGKVTIVKAGTVTITATGAATDNYNGATADYTLTIEKADATLSFAENEIEATYGGEVPANALTNKAGLTVAYSSGDESIATVDNEGKVTIVKAGTVTITATGAATDNYNGATASYTLTIEKADATLSFAENEIEATYGGEVPANALTNEAGLTVAYSSGDESIATVDNEGKVTIVKAGTVTITATGAATDNYNGATASYTLTIEKADATLSFSPNAVTIVEGQEFTAPTLTNEAGLTVTYTSSHEDVATVDAEGKVTIVGVGETTITATGAANDNYKGATATYTLTVEAKPVVAAPTFTPAAGYYNSVQNVTIACETAGADIYYTTDGTEPTTESTKYTAAIAVGENMTIKAIAVKDGYTNSEVAEAEYVIDLPVQIAAPTFMPGSGHYTEAKEVAIACATPGALISYKIGDGEFQPYTKPFVVDHSCTVTAKVSMGTRTVWTENQASATYTINTLTPVEITNGYYQIKNNGSGQYANVQGRKTLTFTNDIDQQAGTVIRVQTTNDGQVKVLRSQAADLQGYADRAMRYVPEVVQMVVNKLHAEGTGELLGNEGFDAIMEKFNESFDYHLYVEGDLDNCRIYGKTPSMQPVVDFYLENQSKVDEKLPMLEGFINDAIDKVLEKTNGRGSSILVPFSLQTIWQRMGGNLTKPVDDASTLAFYRQVLTNKQYVWDFAYQTATFYLEKVKAHPRYEEMKDKMGEFGNYIDKLEQIRPDMKYFIVQENGKVDYISEGNAEIINNEPNTYWTVQPRESFVVNLPESSMLGIEYVTTLYTDFAYTVPKDVTVYKVTSINEQGVAQLVALTGTIPAQTPVLLKSLDSGPKTLTLDINDGTALTDNLLVGPDYLINEYQIRTPQVESVFNLAKDLFGENFYNNYVAQYEHLMLKNAGTVNNKYFWGLTEDDVKKCTFTNDEGSVDCVIRTLSDGDQHLGFYNNWEVKTNQALLVTKEFDPIKLAIKGDVTRDGLVNLSDAVALINIILLHPYEPADFPVIYDYIAADFDENGEITITDAKDLINYLLNHYEPGEMIQPTDGEGEGNN